MRFRQFEFSPGYDWKEWSVEFADNLGWLSNREVKGEYTEIKDGEIVLEVIHCGEETPNQLLVSVRLTKKVIIITTWESLERNDYTIFLDILSKKIILDRKERYKKMLTTFLKTTPKQPTLFESFDVTFQNSPVDIEDWHFFLDDVATKYFKYEAHQYGKGKGAYLVGELQCKGEKNCYFIINEQKVKVYMSEFFIQNFDIVVWLGSRQLIAASKIFK